jgi:glycosyltransferase involved in cell wall biosynthesis
LPASAQLIYDSHEIFLETGTAARLPRPARRLLGAYERRLVRRATALVTVNDEYAAVLRRRVRPARIVIVRNCPPRWEPPAEPPSELRRAAGLTDDEPLLLYHGSLTQHRGIEQLIEAMLEPGLEAAHLVLLGFGGAREELATRVADPRLGGRVHLLPAVPPGRLLDWIAGATIDVIPLQRSTLNHWLCTPNKLWESIAAGVPVVVSDFPAMAPIVLDDDHGALGATCDPASPEAIAVAVRRLLDAAPAERAALRARCLAAAHDRWNWERESARLVELYAALPTLAGGVSPSAVP